jgi:hypothetical protein
MPAPDPNEKACKVVMGASRSSSTSAGLVVCRMQDVARRNLRFVEVADGRVSRLHCLITLTLGDSGPMAFLEVCAAPFYFNPASLIVTLQVCSLWLTNLSHHWHVSTPSSPCAATIASIILHMPGLCAQCITSRARCRCTIHSCSAPSGLSVQHLPPPHP